MSNQMKQADIISKTFCELLCRAKDWLQICVIHGSCPKGTCNVFQVTTPSLYDRFGRRVQKKKGTALLDALLKTASAKCNEYHAKCEKGSLKLNYSSY